MKNLLFLLLNLSAWYSQAQSPWQYENNYAKGKQILESYDGGSLLLAIVNWQQGESRLFKLDQTGTVLWEHSLSDETESLAAYKLVELSNGDLLIGGRTHTNEALGDAFLLKLNACGAFLWYKEYSWPGKLDQISEILTDIDGSIFILQQIGTSVGRFTLKKLNSFGEVLWTQQHLQEIGASPRGMIRSSDGGFVLFGTVYVSPYYDPEYPIGYLRNAVVKTDSLGNQEWRNIYRWEEDNLDTIFISSGGGVQELANQQFIGVTLDRNKSNLRPEVYELNENGALLWHKNIAKPDTMYDLTKIVLLPDSTVLIATSASLPETPYQRHLEVYKMDLAGNKLNEFVDNNNLVISSDVRLTPDSNWVYILPSARYTNGTYSLYALKLNSYTLELDSFVLEDNTIYDYYCPSGVEEQSISFPELGLSPALTSEKAQLRIAPNPATNEAFVYFDLANHTESARIALHNLQGQQISSYPLQAAKGRFRQSLSSLFPGIYVVSLRTNKQILESKQLVVY